MGTTAGKFKGASFFFFFELEWCGSSLPGLHTAALELEAPCLWAPSSHCGQQSQIPSGMGQVHPPCYCSSPKECESLHIKPNRNYIPLGLFILLFFISQQANLKAMPYWPVYWFLPVCQEQISLWLWSLWMSDCLWASLYISVLPLYYRPAGRQREAKFCWNGLLYMKSLSIPGGKGSLY